MMRCSEKKKVKIRAQRKNEVMLMLGRGYDRLSLCGWSIKKKYTHDTDTKIVCIIHVRRQN